MRFFARCVVCAWLALGCSLSMHLAGHVANAAGLRHLPVSDHGVRPQVVRLLVVRGIEGCVCLASLNCARWNQKVTQYRICGLHCFYSVHVLCDTQECFQRAIGL